MFKKRLISLGAITTLGLTSVVISCGVSEVSKTQSFVEKILRKSGPELKKIYIKNLIEGTIYNDKKVQLKTDLTHA
jgi:hypothetical protein